MTDGFIVIIIMERLLTRLVNLHVNFCGHSHLSRPLRKTPVSFP